MKKILFLFCFLLIASFASASIIFSDDFSDGTITDWDQNGGSWSAVTFSLVGAGFDGGAVSHDLEFAGGASISYKVDPNVAGLNGEFIYFTDQNGTGNLNGYGMLLQNATALFRKWTNGVPSTLITSVGKPTGVFHDININHSAGGTITVYVDGNNIGTVFDNTYFRGSKILFTTTNGAGNAIFDNVLINSDGNYFGLIVLRPIDEATGLSINKTWSAQVGATSLSGNDNSKNFALLRGTTTTIIVDDNSLLDEYKQRTYVATIAVDQNQITIQPYLVPTAESIAVKLVVADLGIGNPTIENIRLRLTDTSATTFEEQLTNAAGESSFSFFGQKEYFITAKDENNITSYFPINGTGRITATSSIFYLYIDFNSSFTNPTTNIYDINFFPGVDYFTGTTQKLDVNVAYNGTLSQILVQVKDINVNEYSNTCISSPCNSIFNLTLNNFDSNNALIVITIITPDKNLVFYRNYYVLGRTSGILGEIRSWKNEVGIIPLAAIMFVIIFLAIAFTGNNEINGNNSRIFIIAPVMGLFIFIWFYDTLPVLLLFMGGIVGALGIYLWNRNRS